MDIDKDTGLIIPQNYIHSPNQDDRPANTKIDLLVIHNISLPPGEFSNKYIEDFFTNKLDSSIHPYFNEIKDLQVSSHCVIYRDGKITQFVPFHKRAWHAGKSKYEGRESCNDFSIGIELEGADDKSFTYKQYDILINLLQCLLANYKNLSSNRIVGHSDIAPGRKTDPGPNFDWKLIKNLA